MSKQTNFKKLTLIVVLILCSLPIGLLATKKGGIIALFSTEKVQTYQHVKIFQIGFHKSGTSTLSHFFNNNGIKSVHCDNGHLATNIDSNYKHGKPLIAPKYMDYIAYFDINAQNTTPWIAIGSTLYKELDRQYPNSKFILNTRDKAAWLKSRSKHKSKDVTLLEKAAKMYNLSTTEVLAMWSKEWDDHHEAVLEYFKDRPNDLLVFNIETDPPEKLVNFFKDYYALDPSLYVHWNKTAT